MIQSTRDAQVDFMAATRRERALAEHRQWCVMLEFLDAENARIEREVEPQQQELAFAAVRSVVAQANGWSEHQASARIHEAQTARDELPNVWVAFSDGSLDASRVSVIASGSWNLTKQRSLERLDRRVVAYASTHTVGELRRWMKRFVAQVEPEKLEQRYDDVVAERSVTIHHSIAATPLLRWLH